MKCHSAALKEKKKRAQKRRSTGGNLLPLGGKAVLCSYVEVSSSSKQHTAAIIPELHAMRNSFSGRSTTFTSRKKPPRLSTSHLCTWRRTCQALGHSPHPTIRHRRHTQCTLMPVLVCVLTCADFSLHIHAWSQKTHIDKHAVLLGIQEVKIKRVFHWLILPGHNLE